MLSYPPKNSSPDLSRERQGELLMVAETFIWSWFPIVTLIIYQHLSPLFTMFYTTLIAALFFGGFVLWRGGYGRILQRQAIRPLLLTTLFINLLFICVYLGLQYTSAANMAVILFLQLLFSYLYFNLFGSEPFASNHLFGALLMGAGALIILFPGKLYLNKGDMLVLIAAMIAPIANYYQKQARTFVKPSEILFVRYLLALPVLLVLAQWFSPDNKENVRAVLPWLLLNGLVLFGLSKIFWIEAIHRISITKASAMSALGPLFTIILAYLVLGDEPTLQQLVGFIPVLIGGILITRPGRPQRIEE
ncbi:MAG: DMT family transporter [Deltaproteobacteria bacterium]|nr:DMT family transporter [Candidatus Tharpella aukensis]